MLPSLLRGWRWLGSAVVVVLAVVGGITLVTSLSEVPDPAPREVIVIQRQPDEPSVSPGQTIAPSRTPEETDDPDDPDDDIDDVTAQPDDIDDEDDDDGRDEDDDDADDGGEPDND